MKTLAGLLLIPFCVGATRSLVLLVARIRPASYGEVPFEVWWLLGGFALWLVLYFAMSRPVRTYVFAHEATHALWGYLMGAGVSKLRVSGRGGSVTLSKSNFLITLAPYFFPFYTLCVIAIHGVLALFVDMTYYEPFWLGLVGLTWSFHLTFTCSMLAQRQADIAEYGVTFSYTVIYMLNIIGVSLWIIAVASPTLEQLAQILAEETTWSWGWVAGAVRRLWAGGG